MRRYGLETADLIVPGQDAGLKLSLLPASAAAPDCRADITGLFWFSDQTGAFDTSAEAAYLLPEGGAGPVLGAAKLLGESCGKQINWTTAWTPMSGSGGAPGIWSDGADLVAYPLETTLPGILSVSATVDGVTYGPIVLVIARYECYYNAASSDCPVVDSILFGDNSQNAYESSGSSWSHSGTISGALDGATIEWAFNWTGSPTELLSFSSDGPSCTMTCTGSIGTGIAYCSAAISAPGCDTIYTESLSVYVT